MAADIALTLREAPRLDREALWRIRTRAIRETCCSHYNAADLERWYTATMPAEFGIATKSRQYLVVEAEGVPAGFGMLDLEKQEIAAVFVRPDFLRRGIGAMLLRQLESSARSKGLEKVHLSSTLNAVDFYRSEGYRTLGPGTYRHSGGFELDCILMDKALTASADSGEER